MSTATETIENLVTQEYKYGFVTDVDTDSAPPGLNEDIIRLISAKKKEPQWMTDWRLKAYRHWLTMPEPHWQFVKYPPIDFQDITYYSAPKQKTDSGRDCVIQTDFVIGWVRLTLHAQAQFGANFFNECTPRFFCLSVFSQSRQPFAHHPQLTRGGNYLNF